MRLRWLEISIPSSFNARTACALGGWPSIAPTPAETAPGNRAVALHGMAEEAFRHGAAANISSANEKDGLHASNNAVNFGPSPEIVNG